MVSKVQKEELVEQGVDCFRETCLIVSEYVVFGLVRELSSEGVEMREVEGVDPVLTSQNEGREDVKYDTVSLEGIITLRNQRRRKRILVIIEDGLDNRMILIKSLAIEALRGGQQVALGVHELEVSIKHIGVMLEDKGHYK